nr:FecR domain-containing protein [Candidatus Gracilibacteria bacterium]
MKKFKNKFIFAILFLIILIIGMESYSFYNKNDTNSYVSLVNGTGYINNNLLVLNKNKIVKEGDVIKTVGVDSIAIIEWGDKSITRLGGDSEIKVNENYVSTDLTKLRISFNLTNGKTWTKLISLFGKDSYFKQYIDNVEAGVRGTVFEVNKEKDYVYVQDHEISLINNKTGKEVILSKDQPLSLSTFNLIDLQKFLNSLKDKAWEDLNMQLDNELILKLKASIESLNNNNPINSILGLFSNKYDILNSINSGGDINTIKDKLSKLNETDKRKVFDNLYGIYQQINFLSPQDKDYNKKLYYKEILLQTSYDNKNTEGLVKNTLFDINDMISSNNLSNLNESIKVLIDNKNIVKNLNLDFNNYVNLSLVPDGLKDSLINGLAPLKDIFNINLDIDSIKSLEESARGKINDFLDENVGGLIDSLKNLNK